MLTVSGMHFHAVNTLKNNRRQINRKKEEAFHYVGKNKLVDVGMYAKVPSGFYESLNQIKEERKLNFRRVKRITVLTVFTLVAFLTLGFWYLV